VEEKCGRCGGSFGGRAFVLHGKALCKDCLYFEQDKWEIVSAKPGGAGSRVKIVVEKQKDPVTDGKDDPRPLRRKTESVEGKRIFSALGIDISKAPKDPFMRAGPIDEKKMPDGSCLFCDDYAKGKKRGNLLGKFAGQAEK
jgi:hypothetical protein